MRTLIKSNVSLHSQELKLDKISKAEKREKKEERKNYVQSAHK